MLNAIQQGVLTKSTKQRLDVLEQTRDDLEIKIPNEKMERLRISEEFMRFWLERFQKLDMKKTEHRKMLIDTFVNAIFLYDDKMVLIFNFREGQKTITFDELNKQTKTEKTGSDMESPGEPLRFWDFELSLKSPAYVYRAQIIEIDDIKNKALREVVSTHFKQTPKATYSNTLLHISTMLFVGNGHNFLMSQK